MHRGPSKIVILGRDAAAWLTAVALERAWGRAGMSIHVVELPSLLHAHDVYASLFSLEPFHTLIGIDETEVLRTSAGTFSLGQSFANFSRARPPFFHGYGAHGAAINGIDFFQVWVRARQAGLNVEVEDFSINAAAAKQGRFFIPDDEINQFGRCDFGYHLGGQGYMRHLKAIALRRGITVSSIRNFEARRDAQTGYVTALAISDGTEVEGDLFIDATGQEGLLLDRVVGVPFDDWRHWFPADRLLAVSAPRLDALPAYSQVRALGTGVLHMAPLQDRTCLTRTYFSQETQDEEALQTAAVIAGMRLHDGAVVSALTPGRALKAWEGNVIAIGEAACVFDPIDNIGLHALQLGLGHLVNLLPVGPDASLERELYNRTMQTAFERLRDFQLCHFKLNRFLDKPYWDYVRSMEIPETLQWKIEAFQARGLVPLLEEETFDNDSWIAVLTGHGLMPQTYDPHADLLPDDGTVRSVQRMLSFIRQKVQAMGTADNWLRDHGARIAV